MTRKGNLYPPIAEPIKINPYTLILMVSVFAILFFIIGVLTVHYPHMEAVI